MTTTVPLHGTGDLASFRVASGLAKHGALLGEQLEYVATDAYGVPHAVFLPNPDPRPLAVRTVHDHALSDAELAEAERFYASSGRTLVEYNPMTRESIGSAIPPYTKGLRDRLAGRMRNVKHPHQLEIQVVWDADGNPHEVRILRAPQTDAEDAASRREFWERLIDDELPAPDGLDWRFSETVGFEGRRMVLTLRRDLIRDIVYYHPVTEPTIRSIPFGIDEDGNEVCLGLYERNVLLGGLPGSGKSGGITAFLAGVERLPNVALVGLDPKRIELSGRVARFSTIAKRDDQGAEEHCIDRFHHSTALLNALKREMNRRYEYIENRPGPKKLAESELDTHPLIVIVIDELADLVSGAVTKEDIEGQKKRIEGIRTLIAMGRAAGLIVLTATQKPQSDIIPTTVRDLIQQRVAYATATREMTDTILGGGMSQNGGLSHEISAAELGVAYIVNESSRTPRRIRTYWMPDEDIEGHLASVAHLRVDLAWLPTDAQSRAAAVAAKPQPKTPARGGDW